MQLGAIFYTTYMFCWVGGSPATIEKELALSSLKNTVANRPAIMLGYMARLFMCSVLHTMYDFMEYHSVPNCLIG